jgi:diguanylate cyclase (GGDEF)-like protein
MDRLSIAVLRAERAEKAMALMFLDLDGFKKINDNYGHQAGDALLKQFAERLTMNVRKSDTVARLAGDEFMIILEELTEPEHNVQTIASKIIQAMAQSFIIAGEAIDITTSIGAVIGKSGKKNVDDLIHAADTEMYKAKNKGKNQFSMDWL